MTKSATGFQRGVKVIGQKLGLVTNFFKYIEAIVSEDGSKPGTKLEPVLSRLKGVAGALSYRPLTTDSHATMLNISNMEQITNEDPSNSWPYSRRGN